MKEFFIVASLVLLTFFSGCGNGGDGKGGHDHHAAGEMKLDNGKKWEANAETTQGIARMLEIVDDYQAGSKSSTTELHSSLEKEYKLIFERCTMKGEAHDQLHNFLVPVGNMLKELDGCNGKEACNEVISHIEGHLETYDNYFN